MQSGRCVRSIIHLQRLRCFTEFLPKPTRPAGFFFDGRCRRGFLCREQNGQNQRTIRPNGQVDVRAIGQDHGFDGHENGTRAAGDRRGGKGYRNLRNLRDGVRRRTAAAVGNFGGVSDGRIFRLGGLSARRFTGDNQYCRGQRGKSPVAH